MGSRRTFTVAVFVLAAAVLAFTHPVWAIDWWQLLPAWLAAYLSPARGSLFPLFPWATYVLFGAGWDRSMSRGAPLTSRATQPAVAAGARRSPVSHWAGASQRSRTRLGGRMHGTSCPIQLAIRIGACLIILAAIARASQRLTRLPRFFAAVAQETLPIYFVHLCIVYGSIWNRGLAVWYAALTGPPGHIPLRRAAAGVHGGTGMVLAPVETRASAPGQVDHGRGGSAAGDPASLVQSLLSDSSRL